LLINTDRLSSLPGTAFRSCDAERPEHPAIFLPIAHPEFVTAQFSTFGYVL
jgi:hypothetical protein